MSTAPETDARITALLRRTLEHAEALAREVREALGLPSEREHWTAALADALDGLEDMFPYVPEFFREKWEHQGYIDRARAALALLRQDQQPAGKDTDRVV